MLARRRCDCTVSGQQIGSDSECVAELYTGPLVHEENYVEDVAARYPKSPSSVCEGKCCGSAAVVAAAVSPRAAQRRSVPGELDASKTKCWGAQAVDCASRAGAPSKNSLFAFKE